MKYGYMDDMDHHHSHKSANLLSRDGLKAHIMEFQAFAGLNQTGELDEMTVKMMNMPRCGVKDKISMKMNHDLEHQHHPRRSKRYTLQGKHCTCLSNSLTIAVQFKFFKSLHFPAKWVKCESPHVIHANRIQNENNGNTLLDIFWGFTVRHGAVKPHLVNITISHKIVAQ